MASLKDFYGEVRKCELCAPAVNIHKVFCRWCLNRGYLSTCMACSGRGKTTVPVAGSIGTMDSTCLYCGGNGTFPATEVQFLNQENARALTEKTEKDLVAAAEEQVVQSASKGRFKKPEVAV